MHLLGAEFLDRLFLVLSGQRAVMAFVEAPVLHLLDPHLVHFLERQPQRLDGAGLQRGEGDVEFEPGLLQQRAGAARLGLALGRQFHIPPAGEEVELVPFALAMAQEHELGIFGGFHGTDS